MRDEKIKKGVLNIATTFKNNALKQKSLVRILTRLF